MIKGLYYIQYIEDYHNPLKEFHGILTKIS